MISESTNHAIIVQCSRRNRLWFSTNPTLASGNRKPNPSRQEISGGVFIAPNTLWRATRGFTEDNHSGYAMNGAAATQNRATEVQALAFCRTTASPMAAAPRKGTEYG